MTVLSDRDLRRMLKSGRDAWAAVGGGEPVDVLDIEPEPHDRQFQPCSIDLLLGELAAPKRDQTRLTGRFQVTVEEGGAFGHTFSGGGPNRFETYRDNQLLPGEFRLACTLEMVTIPSYVVGMVHGKSSWARRGLIVHAAGLLDPGFRGQITLELKNIGDEVLTLPPETPICQLTIETLSSPAQRPYGSDGLNSHYFGQRGPTPAFELHLEES